MLCPGLCDELIYSELAMQRIYLDYAATTPTHPEVVKAMLPYFTEAFGLVYLLLHLPECYAGFLVSKCTALF